MEEEDYKPVDGFMIVLQDNDCSLVFEHAGYQKFKLERENFEFTLQPHNDSLGWWVLTGYNKITDTVNRLYGGRPHVQEIITRIEQYENEASINVMFETIEQASKTNPIVMKMLEEVYIKSKKLL